MNTLQATNIDTKTVLLSTLVPVLEEPTKNATTGLQTDERNTQADSLPTRDFGMAIAQWLSDVGDKPDSHIAIDSLLTQDRGDKRFAETVHLKPKFKATFPNLLPKPAEQFVASQRWEGVVLAIHDEIFEARLLSLQGEQKGEQFAEIYIDEVETPDKSLLKVGAVFYWAIGYLRKKSGNSLRASILRFRRLPTLSEEVIEQAEALEKEWGKLFSAPD